MGCEGGWGFKKKLFMVWGSGLCEVVNSRNVWITLVHLEFLINYYTNIFTHLFNRIRIIIVVVDGVLWSVKRTIVGSR